MKRGLVVPVCLLMFSAIMGTPQPTNNLLEIDDVKIHYQARGSGASIVLLHDGLFSSTIWDNQFEELARNYRVIRYDRRGFGKSGISKSSFQDHEDLKRLLSHLKIERVTLVGSSAGGAVALDFALAYPDAVERIVLIGTTVSGYKFSDAFNQRLQKNNMPFIQRQDIDATAQCWFDDPYLAPTLQKRPDSESIKRYFAKELHHIPSLVIALKSRRPPEPAVERLASIKAPVLILTGKKDFPDLHTIADLIEAKVSTAQKKTIGGVGHLIGWKAPLC